MKEYYCKVNEAPGNQEGGTMNEISRERLEGFWKWCGMRRTRVYKSLEPFDRGTDKWVLGEHCSVDLPRVDLNNLFKWAVPKVVALGYEVDLCGDAAEWSVEICDSYCPPKLPCSIEVHNDPAIALFLAIEKLIEEGQ